MYVTLVLVIALMCSGPGFSRSTDTNNNGVVVCYYGSWANYRSGSGRFGVIDIPVDLCTHIIYSFIGLTGEGELTHSAEEIIEGKSNTIEDLINLKNTNPVLKILVAIGGWSQGSENFSKVVNNDTLRANFVNNLYNYLESRGFDGLDLDWEYPAQGGGIESDKEQFVVLVKELKEALTEKGYILTAAVGVTQYNIDTSYDVPALNEYLDYFHLMTYDYHGTWENNTGVNAPLYPQLTDGEGVNLNVNSSVNAWITHGASPEKLVLGLGSYGRTFTLSDLNNASTGAPVVGAGAAGSYTREPGVWAFYEICEDQKNHPDSWTIVEVPDNYVYAHKELFWVGYDNENTTFAKAQYSNKMGLAGIMYWAVDLDDFNGLCTEVYPLIKAGIAGYNAELPEPEPEPETEPEPEPEPEPELEPEPEPDSKSTRSVVYSMLVLLPVLLLTI